jgi:myo-inositol-1(or 4)-monophosphatase
MKQNYSPLINIMLKASRKAARGLIRDFGEICNLQSSQKSLANFTATTISKIERNLTFELNQAKPNFDIITAYDTFADDVNTRWLVNILDGQTNFTHALPFFTLSVAVEKKISDDKSEIIASVIEAPLLGETYWAEKGCGAWLEKNTESISSSSRLRVSNRNNLKETVIAVNEPTMLTNEHFNSFNNLGMNLNILGASELSLAYLAAGKIDTIISYNQNLFEQPASLLIIEAGGSIKTIDNSSIKMIATNNIIEKEFEKIRLFN